MAEHTEPRGSKEKNDELSGNRPGGKREYP